MGKRKKLFLFDIDGTLMIEDQLLPGAREIVEQIDYIGGKSYFLTNNSTLSTEAYVDKFNRLGLKVEKEQFVTAGSVTIEYLKKYYLNQKIYAIATKSYKEEMKRAGLQITEQEEGVQCVVVAFDNELTYKKLQIVCEVLQRESVDFIATNMDKRCPGIDAYIPDCGAICSLITCVTDRVPIYLGKPSDTMIKKCMNETGIAKEDTIMIGDRLYTDIEAGYRAGVDTCVVLTGETSLEEINNSKIRPTYCVQDLFGILKGFVVR